MRNVHSYRDPESSYRPLLHAGLSRVINAWDPSVGRRVEELAEWYPALLKYGWSQTDIEIALELGYELRNHVVQSRCHWTRKYAGNAKYLHWWIAHTYRQSRAEELGMSVEDLVALWRKFARRRTVARDLTGVDRGVSARELLMYYMRARRHGLTDSEIYYPLFSYLDRFDSYIRLRRKFDVEFVIRLFTTTHNEPWYLDEKCVIEADRRGATHDEILASVKDDRVGQLALALRQAQRTTNE